MSSRRRHHYSTLLDMMRDEPEELRRLVAIRTAELIAYQSPRYAASYVAHVRHVAEQERRTLGEESTPLAEAVARNLYQLMAYKDEYEVATLYLSPQFMDAVQGRFERPLKVKYHLNPPAS